MNTSSPRTALKLLTPTTPFRFCSRCGASPAPPDSSAAPATRVCAHCELGLVLETRTPFATGSPFVVIDPEQMISAVSRSAEHMLGCAEPELLGRAITTLRLSAHVLAQRAACGPPPGSLVLLREQRGG
jgi:hypothetical protein